MSDLFAAASSAELQVITCSMPYTNLRDRHQSTPSFAFRLAGFLCYQKDLGKSFPITCCQHASNNIAIMEMGLCLSWQIKYMPHDGAGDAPENNPAFVSWIFRAGIRSYGASCFSEEPYMDFSHLSTRC